MAPEVPASSVRTSSSLESEPRGDDDAGALSLELNLASVRSQLCENPSETDQTVRRLFSQAADGTGSIERLLERSKTFRRR
jgi:hypothetical protein